jgi:hypothetical protein
MNADFAVVGVSGAVLTGLIVELLKKVWPSLAASRWIELLAVGIGVILSIAVYAGATQPTVLAWLGVVVRGLLAGLASMGVYDTGKTLVK